MLLKTLIVHLLDVFDTKLLKKVWKSEFDQ